MPGESVFGVVNGQDLFCREVFGRLRQLAGQGVDVPPRFVILSVFEYRQVDVREFAADLGEMFPVTAVAAYVDFPRRRLQQERSPERLVGVQPASREVARGQAVDGEAVVERSLLVPVEFHDSLFGKAPVFEMFSDAQRADDRPDARPERCDGPAVEVVPVVVGDDQVVDVGHILRTVKIGAFERPVKQREGRRAEENRIDEHAPPVGLDQAGGVAEPDRQVALRRERPEVGADRRHGAFGAQSLLFAEQEFEHAAHASFAAGHQGAGFEVAELAVAVVRRIEDPFAPFTPGQASEARQDGDYPGGNRRREDQTYDHSHFSSFFLDRHDLQIVCCKDT